MPNPVCQANPSVRRDKVETIQQRANQVFTEARPVQDSEMLSSEAIARREQAICEATQSCRGLRESAEALVARLSPPTGLHTRTYANVGRLFLSNRVSTQEIIDLIRLQLNPNAVTAFRQAAQTMFLRQGLFYYDYVPYQGAVMCYMPQN